MNCAYCTREQLIGNERNGGSMEFLLAVVVTLLVYTLFVMYFLRLTGMLRRKDSGVARK